MIYQRNCRFKPEVGLLTPAPGLKQNRFCIYNSAGDHHNINNWTDWNAPREWDLVVTHYGESDEIHDHLCTVAHYANRDKGAEFQNLKKLMSVQPGLFADYDYIRMTS